MKLKLFIISLIAILLLSSSGCGVSFDPDEIEYTAYSYSTEGLVSSTESRGNSSSLRFASASELKLGIHLFESEITVDDAPKTKSFVFENQTVEMTYAQSKALPTQSSKRSSLQERSTIDVYQKDKKIMEVRHSTGETVSYYEGDKALRSVSGDLTLEGAEALAVKLLTKLYGETY